MSAGDQKLDLVCFGRMNVDLYGEQVGAPLGSVESFAKYVGGSAANICVGSARLGLSVAMLSRVGAEDFGSYLVASLAREGVDVSMVQLDLERPTAVVALAERQQDDFPRIFFYRDSPDLAVDPHEVDLELVGHARSILLTGSMLSKSSLARLSCRLARLVRSAGGKVILDGDFRPVLWGTAPIGRGNDMSSHTPEVTQAYRRVLRFCDLIVGTREEIAVIGGSADLESALIAIREESAATIVVKAGAAGATAYPGPIDLGARVSAPAFPVEIVNTVGAGDAFMSGFLSAWLRDRRLEECVRTGNANGALVASRHGCMPAMPVRAELESFMTRGGVLRPDADEEIERLHRANTRRPSPKRLFVLAIDHRWQLEELASAVGASPARLRPLKRRLAEAFLAVGSERDDCGILVDDQYGAEVLELMAGSRYWTARAIDVPRSRPVELLAGDEVRAWLQASPSDHVVKVLSYAHPRDPEELTRAQTKCLLRLARGCRAEHRELLVELQAPEGLAYQDGDLAALIASLYHFGVRPEWWKLPALAHQLVWDQIGTIIEHEDPTCRGVLVLGSTASHAELTSSFAVLASVPCIRGFAIGRAIFSEPAARWLGEEIDDSALVEIVTFNYRHTIEAWVSADRSPRTVERAVR
jgi:5-dehydro-2-deoxygluconokinase